MSSDTVLSATDLHCSYGTGEAEIKVICGASISISRGEVVAVTGPSGSGKSTLLHAMGLLERPQKGRILICGENGWELSRRKRAELRNRRIGFVFQFHHLLEEFTLKENVAMPVLISGASENEAALRAEELLERVGLSHRQEHFPARVSGGERQRAALARALVMKPDLVLADEPTGNLDSESSAVVRELMLELCGDAGVSFLVATHNRELASSVHRQLVLSEGLLHRKHSPVTG